MKKLVTYLATLVLVAQAVLPNFLYATGEDSNGTENPSTPTETVQPTNPASDTDEVGIDGELPDEELVVEPQEDEDDEIEIIIEDEFDFSALESDVEEESIEENKNADEDKSDIYIANKSLLKSNNISLQSVSSFTCPASPTVDGIKSALIDGYEQHPIVQQYDLLNTVKGFSNGNVDVNALLPYLTDENFYYDLASLVEDFAADLTGGVTNCLHNYIDTLGLSSFKTSMLKTAINAQLKEHIVSLLITPTGIYPSINAGVFNFGLLVVLNEMGDNMVTLKQKLTTNGLTPSQYIHQIITILPVLSEFVQNIEQLEFLLTNEDDISIPAQLGIIERLKTIQKLNGWVLYSLQNDMPAVYSALQDMIDVLGDLNTNTFGELNTLLTTNGIAGRAGIKDLLDDVQPALFHLENFFIALEEERYEDALNIAKTNLVNDIDDFKHHPMGEKVLRLVWPLADAAVDELVTKGWINWNGANQIKTAVADLIDEHKDTRTTIIALVQQLTATLESNKIDAPTFENLSGMSPMSTSFTLPSAWKITLKMEEPAGFEEAWAYIAVVTLPNGDEQLFVLAGRDAHDWEFSVPTTGTYTIDIMTLGKAHIINGEKAWEWLSQFGWDEKRDSLSAKLLLRVNASTTNLTPSQKDKLNALVGILGGAIEPLANSLLLQGQTIVKDRIIFANGSAGQRVEVNASGYLKADEVITLLKEMKTLATKGGTVGNFVGALLNPTHSYTLKVEPAPVTPPTWGSSGGGGWGGGSSLVQDNCPNGDNSGSYYDGTCGTASTTWSATEEVLLWEILDEEVSVTDTEKCSIAGSPYSNEENAAYLYACEKDITTMRTIQAARMSDKLTRAEMAKIVSQYLTTQMPERKPNLEKDCSAFSASIAKYQGTDLYDFMTLACQYEVMGVHTVDYTAIADFMPDKFVSRAEFGTIFSRILRGNVNEGTEAMRYQNHLNALKEASIITNTTPTLQEVRAWVFLMIYRSVVNKVTTVDSL